MSATGITIEEMSRLSGCDVASMADHLVDAGLLRHDGSGTRLAHLVGAVSTLRDGGMLWNLQALETAVREGLDQPPPAPFDGRDESGPGMPVSSDERTLLLSGWTFDDRRDAFEAGLIARIASDAFPTPMDCTNAAVHESVLTLTPRDGSARSRTVEILDDRILFTGADAPVIDHVPASSGSDVERTAEAADPASDVPSEPKNDIPRDEPRAPRIDRTAVPVARDADDTHDPTDRQSAWAAALSRSRRSGLTATALAYAAGLRMNDNTRAALLRGGIPTDHILGSVCAHMGVALDVELAPKGTMADPAHYPRLAVAMDRRSTMAVVDPSFDAGDSTTETREPGIAGQAEDGDRSAEPVAVALMRILSAANANDRLTGSLRHETYGIRQETRMHMHRADRAEIRTTELVRSIDEIRRIANR